MLQRKRDWNSSIDKSEHLYVPLQRIKVEATIRSFAANVTIQQVFHNHETVPSEAVYCFPIEEQAAVYGFAARIDDREIIAELKEKKLAQREYNEALREHHGAYLLEQDEESQDNFIINVGALPPNKECHITISYVTELDLVENGTKIRFVVPTTIAPRYNPHKGGIGSSSSTTAEYVQSAPYTIEFHCRVEKLGISRISSLSHPIQIDVNQKDVILIEFAQENTHLDRDIIMDIELAENRSNTIVAVESGALMASFTPSEKDCQRVISDGHLTNEFIFVVDCSGSMGDENKIGLARQAMLLFLKSLPVNCHFNIVRFGSQYKSLFSNTTDIHNEENAGQAERLINEMKADLGGTELLPPLRWLKEHSTSQGHPRQIFLLSDGEISNVDQVLDLCRSMVNSTRIFSFGLGHAPSRSLIKGLARTTNGRFVFIPPGANVDVYVGEQLEKSLQPCITNVRIKLNVDPILIDVVPKRSPPIFVNDRRLVYALLKNDKMTSFDHDISLELYSEQCRLCEAKVNRIPSVSNDGMIARLAAKSLILELEHLKLPFSATKNFAELPQILDDQENNLNQEQIKERIIEISLKYNILSPYTAFVGVERRVETSNADMVLREVPIQISADNQYLTYVETMISQMRREEDAWSQAYYSAQSQAHHHHQHVYNEIRYNIQPISRDYEHNRNDLLRICEGYDTARANLSDILKQYGEPRQHSHPTRIRNDYEHVLDHLDRLRIDHDEARQTLLGKHKRFEESWKCIDDLLESASGYELNLVRGNWNDDRSRRNLNRSLENYDRARNCFVRHLTNYDEIQRRLDDVVQSVEKLHEKQTDTLAVDSEVEGEQLSQDFKDIINAAETNLKTAQVSLDHCLDENRRIGRCLQDTDDSINDYARQLQAAPRGCASPMEPDRDRIEASSSKMRSAEAFLRHAKKKQSSKNLSDVARKHAQGDLDTVRHIIAQQKFNGLWDTDVNVSELLKGKTLSEFQDFTKTQVLITAIIVMLLETHFATLSSMWYGVVQKARKCLLDLFDKDTIKLDTLFNDIRKKL